MHLQKAEEEARALQGVGMGLAALASPYPLGEGREGEGHASISPQAGAQGLDFHLMRTNRADIRENFQSCVAEGYTM